MFTETGNRLSAIGNEAVNRAEDKDFSQVTVKMDD